MLHLLVLLIFMKKQITNLSFLHKVNHFNLITKFFISRLDNTNNQNLIKFYKFYKSYLLKKSIYNLFKKIIPQQLDKQVLIKFFNTYQYSFLL